MLPCPVPLPWELPQFSASLRLAGPEGAGGMEMWGIPVPRRGRGAVEVAGWRGCGVLAPRRREERSSREGKRAEELPCQFAEMLL